MLMNINTQHNLSWDDLFEQATEDISSYLWALEEWHDPWEEHDQNYLLITALSNRTRSRMAMERMSSDEMPRAYAPYRKQLESMRIRAEESLEHLLTARTRIEGILRHGMMARLNMLDDTLGKVRRMGQDRNLSDDSEWTDVNLREIASDFLILFQNIALTIEELREEPFHGTIDSKIVQKRFAEIETRFNEYFGYFQLVSDIFEALQAREYNSDRWWLTRLPDPEDIKEPEIPEELMASLCKTFQEAGASKPLDCPESDKAIDYALHELDPKENRQFREHILSCRYCLDMVLDVRSADAEGISREGEILDMLPGFYEAIQEKSPVPDPPEEDAGDSPISDEMGAFGETFPNLSLPAIEAALSEWGDSALQELQSAKQIIAERTAYPFERYAEMLLGVSRPELQGMGGVLRPPEYNVVFVSVTSFKDCVFLDPDSEQEDMNQLLRYVTEEKWSFTAFFLNADGQRVGDSESPEEIEEDEAIQLDDLPEGTQEVFVAIGPENKLDELRKVFGEEPWDNTDTEICWVIYHNNPVA